MSKTLVDLAKACYFATALGRIKLAWRWFPEQAHLAVINFSIVRQLLDQPMLENGKHAGLSSVYLRGAVSAVSKLSVCDFS